MPSTRCTFHRKKRVRGRLSQGDASVSLPDTLHPPRATARVPTPLHTTPALTMRRHYGIPLVIIVRAGVVWSGVGTLAVALAVGLLLPPPRASPSWDIGATCRCPSS